MTTTRTITTSFPLGLFCNATLSGPLPEVKNLDVPVYPRQTHRKIEYLTPVDLPIEGMKDVHFLDAGSA